MINPPIDKLTEETNGNKYILSVLVSKRSKKILAGDKPLVDVEENEKPITTAAKEVYEHKITYDKNIKEELQD